MTDTSEAPPSRAERVIRAALLFELEQHQADALDDALEIYDSHNSHDSPDETADEPLRLVAGFLADADVADAFVNDIASQDPARATVAEAFGRRLVAATAGTTHTRAHAGARAAAAWLVAQTVHVQQRTTEVEALLDEALEADPAYRPALELGAHYASDRGDAQRAVSLAQRAGVAPTDEWVQMLSSMIPRARSDVGRNDPCPCGSGRKYKQCHLGNESIGLDERAYWLWRRAVDHLQDSPWQHRLVTVADAMLGLDETTYDSMTYAMTDPLVADLVLFVDGGWDDFVRVRGDLLPDDERALAERWSSIPRSVVEVVAIDPSRSVTVRDLRGADDSDDIGVVVRERAYSGGAELGDVVYAHVLPAGETQQFFGGLQPILTETHRDELLELLTNDPTRPTRPTGPTGVEIAALIERWGHAPTRVTTAEGEPLEFITTQWRVADPDATIRALDQRPELSRASAATDEPDAQALPGVPSAFGSPGDVGATRDLTPGPEVGPVLGRWSEQIEVDGQTWVRGTVTLHPDRLVVRANAAPRDARLRRLVHEVLPDADLLHEHHETYEP